MSEDPRPKRRCVKRKTLVPSAVHYVGYVEEDETPEMIMKKFEALEKVMQATSKPEAEAFVNALDNKENEDANADTVAGPSKAGGDAQPADMELDERQLIEVFKQTSIFNVKSALANNTVLLAGEHNAGKRPGEPGGGDSDGALSSDEEDQWNFLKGFWSDDEFFGDKGASKRSAKRGSSKRDRLKGAPASAASGRRSERCHQLITQYNRDTNALIRRRVKVLDPEAILQIRIPPPPVPLSWCRSVLPYVPKHARQAAAQALAAAAAEPSVRSSCFETRNLGAFDFQQLPSTSFLALLINTGWERPAPAAACGDPSTSGSCVVERLRQLPVSRLCPVGFVFIWAEKQHIHAVCKQLYSWGYTYVENLTWVMMAPNNSILRLDHPHTSKSHLTLLIFRKDGEGKDIELRHQRSPDVIFDCVTSAQGREWSVPEQAFCSIETMLPTGKGAFLELWAAKGAARPGWTHIVENVL